MIEQELPEVDTVAGYESLERGIRRDVRRHRALTAAVAAVVLAAGLGAATLLARDHHSTPQPAPTPGKVSNGALVASQGSGVAVLRGHLDHLPQDMARFSAVQFIGEGSELVYSRRSGGLESINVTTGDARLVAACRPQVCDGTSVSPDGTRAAWVKRVGGRYGVQVRELTTGDTTFFPAKGPGWVEWSPDGKALAITGRKGISVMDLRSGDVRVIHRYPSPKAYPLPASWSPDGTTIAFLDPRPVQGSSGPASDWTLSTVDLDGTHVRALRDVGGCYCIGIAPPQVVWSPDGQKIAVSVIGGHINNARAGGVYTINPDGTDFTLVNPSVDATDLAWQPRQN